MKRKRRKNYRLRIGVNLLLCAVCMLAAWVHGGYPLPSTGQAFRRLERMEMLPASRLVLETPKDGMLTSRDGAVLQLGNRWYAGLTREGLTLAHMAGAGVEDSRCSVFPLREESATLVPLALTYGQWGTGIRWENAPEEERRDYICSLLLVDAPRETARVEVQMGETVIFVDAGTQTLLHWQGRGWELSEGVWLLGVQPGEDDPSRLFNGHYWSFAYELRLYDGADNLIHTRSGIFRDVM